MLVQHVSPLPLLQAACSCTPPPSTSPAVGAQPLVVNRTFAGSAVCCLYLQHCWLHQHLWSLTASPALNFTSFLFLVPQASLSRAGWPTARLWRRPRWGLSAVHIQLLVLPVLCAKLGCVRIWARLHRADPAAACSPRHSIVELCLPCLQFLMREERSRLALLALEAQFNLSVRLQVFVRESSMVPVYAVLLFGGGCGIPQYCSAAAGGLAGRCS